MDRDLADVQGIRGDFSIQKSNGSTALFLCDEGDAARDESPVLVWCLHIIVCNPFQPGPSAKDLAGAMFDVWKRVGIPTRCDPDAYHIGKIAEVMNDRKGPIEPSITSGADDYIGLKAEIPAEKPPAGRADAKVAADSNQRSLS